MRNCVLLDDEGRPFRALVLDDGVRVDEDFYRIAPVMARANPVPAHFKERK